MGKLGEADALLRVAMLAAQADGNQSEVELDVASAILADRLDALDDEQLDAALDGAVADLDSRPQDAILADVKAALTTASARSLAVEVAVQVSLADHKLEVHESPELAAIATALGVSAQELTQIRQRHWPLKKKPLPNAPLPAQPRPRSKN